jgi:hypothetical protein
MRKSARCGAIGLLLLTCLASPARSEEGAAPAGDAQTTPEVPKREPISQISGSAPTETLQERMERFKREKGAGSDKPFEGFADQAARQMEQARQEAIASPGQIEQMEAEASVESRVGARERLEDKLASLGAWGGSGCVEIEPAWNTQDDFIRHRKLRADDFLSANDKSRAAVAVPKATPTGFAAIQFSCELEPLVQQASDGSFIARVVRVRYYAVLSRKESWLAEHAESRDAFLLGHQQLHFDMAEEFAKWLNLHRDEGLESVLGVGRTPEIALGQLQLRWAGRMLAVHGDFDTIETAFDRDTKHGTSSEKQTEWAFRLSDGFETLTQGMKLETRAKAKKK